MKTITNLILAVAFITTNLFPSAGPPPPPPLYKAKYKGVVYQSPLITGENTTALFARISYVPVTKLDGKIDLEGTNTNPQGTVNGKNFEWQIPKTIFNIGLAAPVTDGTFLLFNLGFHKMGTLKVSGFEFAFGGMLVNDQNNKLRLTLGLNIHQTDFQWYTYSDSTYSSNSSLDYDPTISLTYNSDFKNWIVNPFFQFSYTKQTLFDNTDDQFSSDVYKNVNVFNFKPGISYNINEILSTNFGVTISLVDDIQNSKNFVLTPHLQLFCYFK